MADDAAPVADARIVSARALDAFAERADQVAVEAPLELRFGGKSSTVLMRTPGHDEELARGFLLTEGVIARAEDVLAMRRPDGLSGDEHGNVLAVELAASIALGPPERMFVSSSSCGVCGKNSIAQLSVRAQPLTSRMRVSRHVLHGLPARLRAAQPVFAATGGVHASALFTPAGDLLGVREDVGRHNALDKLVGWALANGRLPLCDVILLVSGRVSYEIVQKAIAAGIAVVAAVGAPSSLAVDLCEQFAVTLVGFLRADSMNVYAGRERVI
jgi:FdhD protein